jgi:hypothetical protein
MKTAVNAILWCRVSIGDLDVQPAQVAYVAQLGGRLECGVRPGESEVPAETKAVNVAVLLDQANELSVLLDFVRLVRFVCVDGEEPA